MPADNGATPQPGQSLAIRQRYDPDHRVIAVTGACGFLGSQLIRRLEEDSRYARVLAIDIRKPSEMRPKTRFHKVDLTQPTADATLAAILEEQKADSLVHLAFLSRPTHNRSWAHELEAIGTMHVLNACTACSLRKVILGSQTAIYGPHPQNPNFLAENAQLRCIPNSRFLADKLEAERLVGRYASENPTSVVTILRVAAILSHDARNYVSNYLSLPFVPVLMGHDPLVQLIHPDDAVDAFKLCLDADFSGAFNIAGDGVLPLNTILAMAGKVSVPIPHFVAFPLSKALWMTQLLDIPPAFLDFMRYLCVADTSRAKRSIGFAPRHNIRKIVNEFADIAQDDSTSPTEQR